MAPWKWHQRRYTTVIRHYPCQLHRASWTNNSEIQSRPDRSLYNIHLFRFWCFSLTVHLRRATSCWNMLVLLSHGPCLAKGKPCRAKQGYVRTETMFSMWYGWHRCCWNLLEQWDQVPPPSGSSWWLCVFFACCVFQVDRAMDKRDEFETRLTGQMSMS